MRTSYTEDRVDALALKAEEGRGDRRNVPGELHASVEPGESEWGNPSGVMARDRPLERVARGAVGELKHLSSLTKRNQARFPK